MKKLYAVIPATLVIGFAVYYGSYIAEYREREAAAEAQALAEERVAEQERLEYQKQVQQEAIAAAQAKAKARAEKEAREKAEEEAWVALNQAISEAQEQREKLSAELYDATNAYYLAEDRKRRAEDALERKQTEKEHLEHYVEKSRSTLERVHQVLYQAESLAAARKAAETESENS